MWSDRGGFLGESRDRGHRAAWILGLFSLMFGDTVVGEGVAGTEPHRLIDAQNAVINQTLAKLGEAIAGQFVECCRAPDRRQRRWTRRDPAPRGRGPSPSRHQ